MTKRQILEDLSAILEVYKDENDGSYPLALEEAIRVVDHSVSSRVVTEYMLFDVDIDWFIEADEPEECWEHVKGYDLDDREATRDFFHMLWSKFGDAQAFGVLWELFTAGYYIDLDERVKMVAEWV